MEKTDKNVSKQPYHVPQVQDYGNIKAITNAIGTGGRADGGRVDNFKNSQLS
jgi:hypothetical protein